MIVFHPASDLLNSSHLIQKRKKHACYNSNSARDLPPVMEIFRLNQRSVWSFIRKTILDDRPQTDVLFLVDEIQRIHSKSADSVDLKSADFNESTFTSQISTGKNRITYTTCLER